MPIRRRWRCSTASSRPAKARGSTRRSVYRDQIAAQASSYVDSKQGRGNLAVYAILASGQTAEAGEAALRREIARFRDEPVTAAELQEAKNELLTSALRARETADGQASAIAEAVIVEGDAEAANRRLAADRRGDARRHPARRPALAARRAQRRLALSARGSARHGPWRHDRHRRDRRRRRRSSRPPTSPIIEPAPAAERVAPPPPGPEVVPAVPAPVIQRLANGLTVDHRAEPLGAAGERSRWSPAAAPPTIPPAAPEPRRWPRR